MINHVQRHTQHGNHCLRLDIQTKKYKCRCNFPKEKLDTSKVIDNTGYYSFKPKRNDEYMQRYNPIITAIWRGNTAFSPIISTEAVLRYASKAEVPFKSYTKTLEDLVNNMPNNADCKTLVMEVLLSFIGEKDYSVQEVMHILMGWPLHKGSRKFVRLGIKDEAWQLLQVFLSLKI